MVTISFGFWIPILVIFGSEFWSHQRQKCYRNPFLGHFETLKEYGRNGHSYLGKVKFFRVNWITKMYQKRNFSSGRAESATPASCRVKFYLFLGCDASAFFLSDFHQPNNSTVLVLKPTWSCENEGLTKLAPAVTIHCS